MEGQVVVGKTDDAPFIRSNLPLIGSFMWTV